MPSGGEAAVFTPVSPERPPPRTEGDVSGSPAAEEDEWGAATRQRDTALTALTAATTTSAEAGPVEPISFGAAYTAIREQQGDTWRPHLASVKRHSDHVRTGGIWDCWFGCLHTPVAEGTPEYDERDFLLCLQSVALDHANTVHRRMLITVYRRLERVKSAEPDPPTTGPAWEKLGFQGLNPGTDLRSSGIFALLQMLFLTDHAALMTAAMYAASRKPQTEFPFALVCTNFTAVALEALKERGLHDAIAAKKKQKAKDRPDLEKAARARASGALGSADLLIDLRDVVVGEVLCDFFVGVMFAFFEEWKAQPTRKITDFADIKGKLRPYARKHVSEMVGKQREAALRRSTWVAPSAAKKSPGQKVVLTDNVRFGDFTNLDNER